MTVVDQEDREQKLNSATFVDKTLLDQKSFNVWMNENPDNCDFWLWLTWNGRLDGEATNGVKRP